MHTLPDRDFSPAGRSASGGGDGAPSSKLLNPPLLKELDGAGIEHGIGLQDQRPRQTEHNEGASSSANVRGRERRATYRRRPERMNVVIRFLYCADQIVNPLQANLFITSIYSSGFRLFCLLG